MFDFPNTPTPGQIFNTGVGPIFMWDTVAWTLVTAPQQTALSRNLIVNPCGHASQENGQTAGTVTGYYIADQWPVSFTGSGAAINVKSDSTIVNPSGSLMRLLFKTTTAKVSLAAGDFAGIGQKLEGTRIYPLGYTGNTPVQSLLRFNFNGPAGTYSISFRNPPAYTLSWIGQFVITAAQANTDTTQLLVIPPPPSGYVWTGGAAAQIEMWASLAAGTTFIAPATGWQAGNFLAGPGQANHLGVVNNLAQIWDVGFYADPNKTGVPPPFEVPELSDDLYDSQRYWEIVGLATATFAYSIQHYYGAPKRAAPTLALNTGAANGATFDNGNNPTRSFRQAAAASPISDVTVRTNARM
jgi:hypothetical protein